MFFTLPNLMTWTRIAAIPLIVAVFYLPISAEMRNLTATVMCKENNLPIVVFDMDTKGNLKKVIEGEPIGTLVYQK